MINIETQWIVLGQNISNGSTNTMWLQNRLKYMTQYKFQSSNISIKWNRETINYITMTKEGCEYYIKNE